MKMLKKYSAGFFILTFLTVCLVDFGFKSPDVKQDDKPINLAEYKKQIARKDKIILAYFSAHWCHICAKVKPLIDQVENDYKTKLQVLRLDTDRDKEVANEFEIDALPVLILYKNGSREWVHVGLIEKHELKAKIESY